jgi:hypothetical protein
LDRIAHRGDNRVRIAGGSQVQSQAGRAAIHQQSADFLIEEGPFRLA